MFLQCFSGSSAMTSAASVTAPPTSSNEPSPETLNSGISGKPLSSPGEERVLNAKVEHGVTVKQEGRPRVAKAIEWKEDRDNDDKDDLDNDDHDDTRGDSPENARPSTRILRG
mmetsp:Transcript_25717/g.36313  ORF Transcript_25717/g.36313 Transcript_25717/m.36313 type:complete len:113 (+) Transcript_25717:270-608(+)